LCDNLNVLIAANLLFQCPKIWVFDGPEGGVYNLLAVRIWNNAAIQSGIDRFDPEHLSNGLVRILEIKLQPLWYPIDDSFDIPVSELLPEIKLNRRN